MVPLHLGPGRCSAGASRVGEVPRSQWAGGQAGGREGEAGRGDSVLKATGRLCSCEQGLGVTAEFGV